MGITWFFSEAVMIEGLNDINLQWKPIFLKLPKGLGVFRALLGNWLDQSRELNKTIMKTLLNGIDQKLKTCL